MRSSPPVVDEDSVSDIQDEAASAIAERFADAIGAALARRRADYSRTGRGQRGADLRYNLELDLADHLFRLEVVDP